MSAHTNRRGCAVRAFCEAKPRRKAEFISAAQVKSTGVPAERSSVGKCAGTPEEVAQRSDSYTGQYLKKALE